ncbi:MAG: sigma-54 dependent transcriptional regulator [Deltaproteobacteria bacterium]|nr:sigma-54 dependent transcriptional regulator [Deltaproteobacteria bacterium]
MKLDPNADLETWRIAFAPEFIGDDPRILESLTEARNVADTDCTVLVTGETGTGKELVARMIHGASPRANRALVPLNCAAIPDSLIEAELFGHTKGAFTGAIAAREGRLASADGGTLFLDEIGELPLQAQAKLLRVLQDGMLTPVGADKEIRIDVRVIAATNRDLEQMVDEGTFRADLYYRLTVIQIDLPALRERADDIAPMAHRFLTETNARLQRSVTGLDASAERVLKEHAWRGNVRELAHTIERSIVMKRGGVLTAADIRFSGKKARPIRAVMAVVNSAFPTNDTTEAAANDLNLRKAVDTVEEKFIRTALERTAGNRTEAAALLGLNRTTLVERLRKIAV